jgi:nanoRNase/pAp phosphatase (c-di-AMP/oligoRNAs hydrolase)
LKSFCISHRKDVDGLGSASIVVAATGAEILLSEYDDIIANLGKVPPDVERFFLCDIGTDNADAGEFVELMKSLARRCKVTYIDHHLISQSTVNKLKRAGVKVVHDEKECASILTYVTLQKELPQGAHMMALYGAVTDYMDDSPIASKLMEQFDRQLVLLEASMLSFALGRKAGKEGFPEMVVDELSKLKRPHEIDGVPALAMEQLQENTALEKVVKDEGKLKGRLAYMVTKQYSTGNVAKLLIGAFGVPVGIAMKETTEGWYEVSLRSTSECRVHLGRLISKISAQMGGSGGGHRKAAGCRIPFGMADEMVDAVARAI